MNAKRLICQIREKADLLKKLDNQELRKRSLELKFLAMTGTPVQQLVSSGFPLVIEAARRTIQQVHYDVQLQCGLSMVAGRIAEMKTGEGKTLTASLAAHVFALYGRGVHVVTFNEYLATRDSQFLQPVFDLLGLSVGVLTESLPPEHRRTVYEMDITYGAAKEFGFDFLRDRMQIAASGNESAGVMRGTHFAMVDEADSILIDEARTPLIIGMVNQSEEAVVQSCYRWAAGHSATFEENTDFKYDHLRQTVQLTNQGIHRLRSLPQNSATTQVSIRQLYEFVQNAIKVRRDFHLDKSYAIRDGEILIIDEFTGRPAEGRQWQGGIHQSVQAKENVEITPATRQAATITVQAFFKRYSVFCGMTGTAWTSKREFRKVYKKRVTRIPTHRPINRVKYNVKVFRTTAEKFKAITTETNDFLKLGRAVLIGTRSVGKSEALSEVLTAANIKHSVLNASNIESEAEIVANAGQPGHVVVATNMAGRGTDIKLHPSVEKAGGLHVILTEIHESIRIDWQLIGRGSRQGAPGSYRIFVALDDEILRIGFGPQKSEKMQSRFSNRPFDSRSIFSIFRKAQRKTELRYLVDRLMVLKRDEERRKSHFDTGQDPFLNVVGS